MSRPRLLVLPLTCALATVLAAALLAAMLPRSPGPAPSGPERIAPAAAQSATTARPGARWVDPRLRRQIYVNRDSQAWRISRGQPRFRPIGNTPQAMWVGSEWMPVSTVRRQMRTYATKANRAGRTPLVAIYAIPGRDCGGHSAGGLSPAQYRTWITRVADGLRRQKAIAVLEPDALGLLEEGCGDVRARTALLRFAVNRLADAKVWVYIDAAHNAWVPATRMAALLDRAGVRRARGFSVNVASFVRTGLEMRYANRVGRALVARGIRHKKYVMDTSRNGHGQVDGNDWCNPQGARLGPRPRVVRKGRLDRFVWVKAPGESDGPCHGGPPAGQWFPRYAMSLMGR